MGSYLVPMLLKDGHFVTVVTRRPGKYREEQADNRKYIGWNEDLAAAMEEADTVINMAGENIFRRWTESARESIYNSRISSTRQLVEAMQVAGDRPDLFISVSGVSYYGDSGGRPVDESGEAGDDFLAGVCKDWEGEALKAEALGVRVAIARFGIALQDDGGMVEKMKLPFSLFVGGPVGHGEQFVPWIHMRDLCNAVRFPAEAEDLEGPYNVCSPNPVTMNELARIMGQVMNRPSFFRVPVFAVRLLLGEGAANVMNSLNVKPVKLRDSGFEFEFEDPEEALADIL